MPSLLQKGIFLHSPSGCLYQEASNEMTKSNLLQKISLNHLPISPKNQVELSFGLSPSRSSYETGTLIRLCTETRFPPASDCSTWFWTGGVNWEPFETLVAVSLMDDASTFLCEDASMFCAGGCLLYGCLNCFCKW